MVKRKQLTQFLGLQDNYFLFVVCFFFFFSVSLVIPDSTIRLIIVSRTPLFMFYSFTPTTSSRDITISTL